MSMKVKEKVEEEKKFKQGKVSEHLEQYLMYSTGKAKYTLILETALHVLGELIFYILQLNVFKSSPV